MTDSPQTLGNYVPNSSSILLAAPLRDSTGDSVCVGLLTRDPPAESNVLSVTLTASPAERLSVWQREAGPELPARAVVVDARRDVTETEDRPSEPGPASVVGVPENPDLYDIALAIASQLGAWKDTDETTVMCLHSVTALLASYDSDQVIALIGALNALCEDLGVVAHHHVDLDEHDDETAATLRPLYDAVIEHTPDDGWIPTEHTGTTPAPTFGPTTPPPGGTAETDPDRSEAVPMRYSFDTLLELVSSPRRRTLLYNLKRQPAEEISLDQLVEEVHNIDRSLPIRDAPSRQTVRTELVHVHLPLLRETGIVQYDADSETVRYTENRGLESFLRYIETIELG